MTTLLQTLIDGLRATLFRTPSPRIVLADAGRFVALIAVYLLVSLLLDLADADPPWRFHAGGILVVLGDALFSYIAGWLLAVFAQRRDVATGAACAVLASTIMTAVVVHWPLRVLMDWLLAQGHDLWSLLVALIGQTWWFFVLLVIAHALMPQRFGRALAASTLAFLISAASWWWLPSVSMVDTLPAPSVADLVASAPTGNDASDDSGQVPDAGDFDAEQAMYDQPALLDAALAKLAPRVPGKPNLYVVAFAGDGAEDVFRNEAEYVEQLFSRRFDAAGHVVVLENNPATVTTRPLATWTNLHRTLQAIAQKADPLEDIVLLYLTTHGSSEHELLVDLDPLPLNQIYPQDLGDAFKTTPALRWRVIIVNACYSGGFIDALRDDSTLVLTSARADRTSFGCGADSDITYFGKAFLVEALNRTTSLPEAFAMARQTVATWETADAAQDPGLEHSEPQIASTPSILAKLARWQATLPQRPQVQFVPADPARRK